MLLSDWLRYSLSILQQISSSGEYHDKANFVFRNKFREITNTSLFLLKQLDYSLEI